MNNNHLQVTKSIKKDRGGIRVKLFTLSALGIAMLMFVCVLFGMQQANSGIHKMRGYEDSGFDQAVSIQSEDGNVEATMLGENVTSQDLAQKKQQLEEMRAFNLLSSMGKGLADTISSLVGKGVSLIGDTMEEKDK